MSGENHVGSSRAEDREPIYSHDSNSEEKSTGQGSSDGSLDRYSGRGVSDGQYPTGGIVGGILSQLIKDTQDRLAEVRECVSWYQREEEKVEARLQDLETLSGMAKSVSSDSEDES